jgi:ferredoxin-NADP reductase
VRLWYEQTDARPPDAVDLPAQAVLGRADLAALELPGDPAELTAYPCGPLPVHARGARAAAEAYRVPASAVHYEVFGPDPRLAKEF